MKPRTAVFAMAVALLAGGAAALADGMIVPVRPDLRVRGSWSVKYHHVQMTVRDQVASVTIDQEFVNDGSGMIEVEYLFPIPPGAAIDAMTLMVDGKEFVGKLMKADEARKIYEDIVRSKKDPALLEYAGFGLYRTRAFPLQPGKPCKVVVNYKNICKKDRDLVEVWYPLNTEKFSAKKIESVEVKVDVKAAADITAIYSPTHDLNVERKDARHAIVTYSAKDALPATDFQVFYKAADEDVAATLLTRQADAGKDGYFLMLVSPNPRSAGRGVVAKDAVVVLDHSGSMSGQKLDQAKEAVRYVLKNLNRGDRFNVVVYNDGVETFFSGLEEAGETKIAQALDRLDRVDAGGGTNLDEALTTAMKIASAERKEARPAYVIFMTDGLPTVGRTDEKDILADTQKANEADARLFAFGVGYDVNVRLLDRLVNDNHGRSDYVKPKEAIEAKISSLYNKIKNPIMTALKVRIENLRLRDMYPRELGDLFDGDQIVLVGRYQAEDLPKLRAGEGSYRTNLVVSGNYEGKERAFEYPVQIAPAGDSRHPFVEQLWAVRRVGYLLDEIQLHGESKEIIDELVRLSRDYGIMTPYTSFLADERTALADRGELLRRGGDAAKSLGVVNGAAGQVQAKSRQMLREAARPAAPSAAPVGGGQSGARAEVWGYAGKADYEEEKRQSLEGIRQAGDQAMYRRRGKVWVTPDTAGIDLEKDAAKIVEVKLFSEDYFDLIRENTVPENQVLASQQPGEELVVKLRGQVYRIR